MKFSLLTVAILCAKVVMAQLTGAFSLNIAFDEPDYNMTNELAFFVPTDYDPSNSYPLIVGFRGGPHSGPDHLRDQLQPLSDNLNCIIMCPESVVLWQTSQENLVKPLFQHAVDTTAALYNIDMDMIYVTGLSFGGRHTVIVGMDTDYGPIYPNLRGLIPFAAGSDSDIVANYDADTGTPLCTCIGNDDSNFFNISYSLHFNATGNYWTTMFNSIPGVGHTMAFPTFIDEMMECIEFIEAQYVTSIDELSDFELEIFPNPASDHIEIRTAVGHDLNVEIHDQQGRIVLRLDNFNSTVMRRISIGDLKSGIYSLRLTRNEKSQAFGTPKDVQEIATKRFVIDR